MALFAFSNNTIYLCIIIKKFKDMKKYFLTSSERDALLSLLSDALAANDLKSIRLGEIKEPFYEIHPFILISQLHYDILHGIQYTLSKL